MANCDHLKNTLHDFYEKIEILENKFLQLGSPERSLNICLALLEQNKRLGRKNGSGQVT